MLVPAILLLIATILPFWQQEFQLTFPNLQQPFPNWSSPGLRAYAEYAPCTVFESQFCGAGVDTVNTTAKWRTSTMNWIEPVLARILRGSCPLFEVQSCLPNTTAAGLGARAATSLWTTCPAAPMSATIGYQAWCPQQDPTRVWLAPMINITTAVISAAGSAAILPDEDSDVGLEALPAAALLERASDAHVRYDLWRDSCSHMLSACAELGYRYVWVASSPVDGLGRVHRCTGMVGAASPPDLTASSSRSSQGRSGSGDAADNGQVTVQVCIETVYEPQNWPPFTPRCLNVHVDIMIHYYG